MLQSYFTIAIRNLWRNKTYTLINIFGLGVGLATMVWAVQNYRWALSYNSMHENTEDIFRVLISREESEIMRGIVPYPIGPAAAQDFSVVSDQVRIIVRGFPIREKDKEPLSGRVHFVDEGFFSFFNFPLLAGNNDLSDKSGILLTEEMAIKYFGIQDGNYNDVLGKTIVLGEEESEQLSFIINGVLKDVPKNSSVWFDFLTNVDNLRNGFTGGPIDAGNWELFIDALFLKLKNPADAPGLAADFNKYIGPQNKAREDWKVTGFKLEPMAEVANHDNDLYSNSLFSRPPDSATFGPFVLAILIFLVCCLNFTNTTIARSNRRLKEMGVRKVMGGTQQQLVWQMLLECGFIVLLAVFVSVQINEYWLPAYNEMWQYLALEANYLSDTGLLVIMAGLVIGTTLLAGGYPAFYISRFNPTNIFKGVVKFGGSNLFSRGLLGLQVAISLITVIAGIAFFRNSEYQKTYDYGYEMEDIIFANTKDESTFTAFQNEIDQLPNVELTAGARQHIGYSYYMGTMESQGERKETGYIAVGEDYVELMGLSVIEGRDFDSNLPTDFETAVLVNEKMIDHFGWEKEDVIGQSITFDSATYSVIGLLDDFHADDLYSPMIPLIIKLVKPDKFRRLVVSAAPGKLSSVQDQMKVIWSRLFPYTPHEFQVQNEMKADALETTDNIALIFSIFAIISVLLTAIGLFALVSQTVLKKMKEIAIRKVVGATPRHIVAIVNRGYVWIFLVAAIIGCYGGWYLTKLLMDIIFEYNVGVGSGTLIFSSAVIFLMAALTVGVKIRHALNTNPSEILNRE